MTTTADAAAPRWLRIVCCTSSLTGGGAERVLATLANEWSRTGHQVRLVTFLPPSPADYPLDPAVERATLDVGTGAPSWVASALRNLRRIRRLHTQLRQHRADVLLAFMESPNIVSILAGAMAGVPTVVSERIDPRTWTPALPWRVLRRVLYPRAARVVVQTEGVAAGWAHRFLRRERVAVLPNPVRIPDAPPPPLAGREKVIVGAGRLDAQKGFDVLIRAFARHPAVAQRYVLEIAGEGPERAALEALAVANGVGARVRFLGRVRDLDVRLGRARLFVLASRFEGFPNVLLEALAAGTPVVATDCPSGPREILGAGGRFAMAPVEDADRIADAIAAELERTDELTVSAARTTAQQYDAPRIAARWERLLRDAAFANATG